MNIAALQSILTGIGVAALFVFVDAISAQWARAGNGLLLFFLFACAPFAYIAFGLMTRTHSVSVVSGLVNTWIVVGTIAVGILYFRDPLSTKQIIGLAFAVMSVFLLSGK